MKARKLAGGRKRRAATRVVAPRGPVRGSRTRLDEAGRAQRAALGRAAVVADVGGGRVGRRTTVPTARDVAETVSRQLGRVVSVRTVTRDLGPREAVVRRARKAAAARARRKSVAAALVAACAGGAYGESKLGGVFLHYKTQSFLKPSRPFDVSRVPGGLPRARFLGRYGRAQSDIAQW